MHASCNLHDVMSFVHSFVIVRIAVPWLRDHDLHKTKPVRYIFVLILNGWSDSKSHRMLNKRNGPNKPELEVQARTQKTPRGWVTWAEL